MSTERNSFIRHSGGLRRWEYGVARLLVEKDVTFNSKSKVNISGENALSVASVSGNIAIKTTVVLSCDSGALDGKCVGGYMPSDKPPNWFVDVIPGKFIP